MGQFNFGHRGRDPHQHACERCGGVVHDERQRWCEPCRISGGPSNRAHWDEALDMDAPIDEPPLEYPDLPTAPTLPTLRTIQELQEQAAMLRQAKDEQLARDKAAREAEARHAEQAAAYVDRWAWVAKWCETASRIDAIPWPDAFDLDGRCRVCRAIVSEQLRDLDLSLLPANSYRCLRHSQDASQDAQGGQGATDA